MLFNYHVFGWHDKILKAIKLDKKKTSLLYYKQYTIGTKNIDAQYENLSLLWKAISPESLGQQ